MNLTDLLRQRAADHPDLPALVDRHRGRDRCLTFGELAREVDRTASTLHARGLRPGDPLLVFHPVALELYLILLAAFQLGVVVVLADPSGGRPFLRHVCQRTRPRAFFGSRRAHLLRWLVPAIRRIPCHLHPSGWWPGSRPLRRTAPLDLLGRPPRADSGPATPALITFTSGSTGVPKAAVRSHGFLLAQHGKLAAALALAPGQRDLVTLPVFALANLASGVTSVLADCDLGRPASADPRRIAAQCARWQVTRTTAAPAFLEALLADGPPPHFQHVFTGGAPVFPDMLDRLAAACPGVTATAVYGSTEAEPIAELPTRELDPPTRAAITAGRGLPAGRPLLDLAILPDRFGSPIGPFTPAEFAACHLPPGATGEIVVAGPQVLGGYLDGIGDHETKFRVGSQTWHRTGDAGSLDATGRLWLAGRCAARICRPNQPTAYPLPIEAALRAAFHTLRTAALDHHGQLLLVTEGPPPPTLPATAHSLGADTLLTLPAIPRDRRHQSKIDYPALQSAVARATGIIPLAPASRRSLNLVAPD